MSQHRQLTEEGTHIDNHWTGLVDWTGWWTGLNWNGLDWPTGLAQNAVKCLLHLVPA